MITPSKASPSADSATRPGKVRRKKLGSPFPKKPMSGPQNGMTASERVYLAASLDPSAILRSSSIEPDPWQTALLTSQASRILLCASRQSGKSTTAAALAVWHLVFAPDSVTVIISPSLRQSQESFRRVIALFEAFKPPITISSQTGTSISLRNNSRVLCTPATERSVRGFTADLVIVDEASRVPDEVFHAMAPSLAASQGRLLALSTPAGRAGWFWRLWDGDPGWERFTAKADELGRFKPEFLESERRVLGDRLFLQEYHGEFLASEDDTYRLCKSSDVDAMFSSDVPRLFP